jgi:hypothetical protein
MDAAWAALGAKCTPLEKGSEHAVRTDNLIVEH